MERPVEESKASDCVSVTTDLRFTDMKELLPSPDFSYDVVVMDVPWDDMSHEQIMNLRISDLTQPDSKGFVFLWCPNQLAHIGFRCIENWGYSVVDTLIWIKSDKQDRMEVAPGRHFGQSAEMIVVGFKKGGNMLDT